MRLEPPSVPAIDFARPQPVFDRLTPWAGWAMLGAALVLAAVLIADHARLLARRDQAEIALRAGGAQQHREAPVPPALAAEIRFADEGLEPGRIPWEAVFRDIETASAAEILVIGMNFQGARREVRVSGEASDVDALSAYMARLGSRPALTAVRLLSHQPLARDGRSAIRFELVAQWRAG